MKNARVQEGENPSENPESLINEFDACNDQWEELVKAINRTNCLTKLDDGKTITDLIAEKDSLMRKINILNKLSESATITIDRYSRSEIKHKSTVNVAELQKEINDLSKKYRELDTRLQGLNWTIDCIYSAPQ